MDWQLLVIATGISCVVFWVAHFMRVIWRRLNDVESGGRVTRYPPEEVWFAPKQPIAPPKLGSAAVKPQFSTQLGATTVDDTVAWTPKVKPLEKQGLARGLVWKNAGPYRPLVQESNIIARYESESVDPDGVPYSVIAFRDSSWECTCTVLNCPHIDEVRKREADTIVMDEFLVRKEFSEAMYNEQFLRKSSPPTPDNPKGTSKSPEPEPEYALSVKRKITLED